MKYDPNKHHRKSIRLKHYDYSRSGAYFITFCAWNRACLFGQIGNGGVVLSDAGKIAKSCWLEIPNHFPNVQLDEFIVMPNHIHGIIIITDAPPNHSQNVGATLAVAQKPAFAQKTTVRKRAGATLAVAQKTTVRKRAGASPAPALGDIIGAFKSLCVKKRLEYIKQNGLNLSAKIRQRNYYEHIVRNETDLNKIREYIILNPVNWKTDENYL